MRGGSSLLKKASFTFRRRYHGVMDKPIKRASLRQQAKEENKPPKDNTRHTLPLKISAALK